MSSKKELYKVLLESSPFGTLFFVYGVCIESNSKALELLDCQRSDLIGTSIDEISGNESLPLIDLKLNLKKAIQTQESQVRWNCPVPNAGSIAVDITVKSVTDKPSEYIVTLMESTKSASKPLRNVSTEAFRNSNPIPSFIDKVAEIDSTSVGDDLGLPASMSMEKFLKAGQLAREDVSRKTQQDMYFDKLTRLPNRIYLTNVLNKYFSKYQSETGPCGALLMIDLNHFKNINDSWGHKVGDQVIKKVGTAIAHIVKGGNILARLGGDEFVLFIPKVSDNISEAAWHAQKMAEKVRETISMPVYFDGHEMVLTASIGIALLTDQELTAERALQYADSAMYESKRKGSGSIVFFDPRITEKAQKQIGLNIRLRKAIDNQEFALYVQPQVDVKTGRITGGEALLRWVNSEKTYAMPSEFIPVLEASGLIVDVGHWVIRTACEYLRTFIDSGLWSKGMQLSVNVSPRQFRDPQLLSVIKHSLESYDIEPGYLNFEITENLLIDDVEEVITKMNEIKALGSNFSIDDFGVGYSSMMYLKRLPFDELKIDREFIRNIHNDPESRGVVEAIMAVSKQYGLEVVAEGVEDEFSLEVLEKVGCETYQGAHCSMPVPVERFREMLAA